MSAQTKIENFWYSEKPIKWLLFPFSLLIKIIALTKRFLYFIPIFKVYKNPLPVIVVGNITVGGTGKTPFITYLVQAFQTKGLTVGIVSRGYQSKLKNYPHILTQSDSVIDVGDEAYMLYSNLKVPMAIGPNRAEAVSALSSKYKLDLVISDDGLQHYSMARDFEILMVDSTRFFGNGLMLPFGPLREPISRISSVDYIVQNGESKTDLGNDLLSTKRLPLAVMNVKVVNCVNLLSLNTIPLSELNNYSICAVAGIGNPDRFFNSLSEYSTIFEKKVFNDHHLFQAGDFDKINQELVIMTEKDAVKCRSFAKDNWYYLQIKAGINNQDFNNLYELLKHKNILN